MTTAAQKKANKQNAEHSTGPRTDQGKQRSSQNALKHGLRAKEPLIPGEDVEEFYRHSGEHFLQLHPDGIIEETLVEQLIDISWRLKRCGRLQTAMLNEIYDTAAGQPDHDDADPDQIFGKSLVHGDGLTQVNRLSRYEAQLSRQYHRVLREFRGLRRAKIRSRLLNGPPVTLDTRRSVEPAAANKSKPPEQTQSIASLLESVCTMGSLPDPPDLDDPEVYREYVEQAGQPGTQEAAA